MNMHTTFSAAVLFSLLVPCSTTAQGLQAPDRKGSHELHMIIEHDRLAVSGGSAFDPCAIMFGLEETEYVLPGDALLSVVPLVVLSVGNFDAGGELSLDLRPWTDRQIDVGIIFAQAITIRHDSEFFATSNVELLGIAAMTGPRTQPLDDDGVDTEPVDDGFVDTAPLDDSVKPVDTHSDEDMQPLKDGPRAQKTDDDASTSTSERADTAPLDNSAKTAPLG
jgi:hypothetical protein